MLKSVIKEIFIILLLSIAIALILGILCLIFTLDIFPINFGKLSTIIQFP